MKLFKQIELVIEANKNIIKHFSGVQFEKGKDVKIKMTARKFKGETGKLIDRSGDGSSAVVNIKGKEQFFFWDDLEPNA